MNPALIPATRQLANSLGAPSLRLFLAARVGHHEPLPSPLTNKTSLNLIADFLCMAQTPVENHAFHVENIGQN
jgi:hypothetical protein